MRIQVAYAGPDAQIVVDLDVAAGTSVAEAFAQSGIEGRIAVPRDTLGYAIFGRRVAAAAKVTEGDRVEITRPLLRDPAVARRRRAARRG